MEDSKPPADELDFENLPEPGNRFKLGNKIGSGVSGKVYQADDIKTGTKVAVKVLNLNRENENDIKEEYRILRDFSKHPNLPEFYGIYLKKGRAEIEQIWLVMELCQGGNVTDLVKKLEKEDKKMNELHIAYILRETVKALIHLHENRIVHRDIRGNNILLTKDGIVKVIDYGISRSVNRTSDKTKTLIGSPCWLAPEIVTCREGDENGGYDNRVDVWALGITAIELGDGRAPFEGLHPARALFQIARNPPPTFNRPASRSQMYNDFVSECLEKNAENRPFIQELLEHPFFESVNENVQDEIKSIIQNINIENAEPKKPDILIKKGHLKKEQEPFAEKILQEDLAALENVAEDAILSELHERAKKKQFYTFVGDVLLALNPNEKLDIFKAEYQAKHRFKARSDNAPHIYSIADSAYQDVLHHEEPQHIMLSGETGSGKTTNMIHVINQLLYLGQGNECCRKIEKAVNVIHALGNSGTMHNPNSTRNFLQTQITFTATGKVSGAIFWLYQLEKTRVTLADRKQANFHIFYYFYDAIENEGLLQQYNLEGGRDYKYLRTGPASPTVKPGARENPLDNRKKFEEFENSLKELEFDQQQLKTIKNTLAAILLLGEIVFEDDGNGKTTIENKNIVQSVADLLDLDEKKFSWSLLNYCVITKGEPAKRHHTKAEAIEARDVLARGIYFRLVDWIINNINQNLSISRAIYGDRHCVNVIDFFGFECNNKNRLEQLFINSINEQMQFYYNQRVFVWEMQNAEEEEIPVPNLQFYDNKSAIDQLMSKPTGLMYLLDESTKKEDSFYLTEAIQESSKPYITVIDKREFSIAHYTGKVTYDSADMSDKNRDFLPPEMIETMRMSSNDIIKQLFSGLFTKTGNLTSKSDTTSKARKNARWSAALVAENENRRNRTRNAESRGEYSQSREMRTAAAAFRSSCLEVLKKLTGNGCGVHFVRCVRTDVTEKAGGFQPEIIRQQLRALSVLDTIRARQRGYSYRVSFGEFIRRYKFLAFDFDENVEVTKENCRLLLIRLKMEGWAVGKTKVFLKYYNEEYLSRLYETQVKKIVKVQSMMRAFIAKRNLLAKIKKFQEDVGKCQIETPEIEELFTNEKNLPDEENQENQKNQENENQENQEFE